MMRAHVRTVDPNIEEEMELVIDGHSLIVFAADCPYQVWPGKDYDVALSVVSLWDCDLRYEDMRRDCLEHLGGYRYRLSGELDGQVLRVFSLCFDVENCLDYVARVRENVSLIADRIAPIFSPNDGTP